MDEIVLEKMKRNEEKYPVDKAYGSKEKYTELKGVSKNCFNTKTGIAMQSENALHKK